MRWSEELVNREAWRRPSVVALVAANLVPLGGVLFLGWEVFPLVLLFWSENLIVGFFNVLKMALASGEESLAWPLKAILIPFFCFHYGMFCLVHGVFVMALFGGSGGGPPGAFRGVSSIWTAAGQWGLGWAMLALLASHGFSFGVNYVGNGEYRRAKAGDLMAAPYGRIAVLHVAIIAGGFLVMVLRTPVLGLLLLVGGKILLDVRAHVRERQRFARLPDRGEGG